MCHAIAGAELASRKAVSPPYLIYSEGSAEAIKEHTPGCLQKATNAHNALPIWLHCAPLQSGYLGSCSSVFTYFLLSLRSGSLFRGSPSQHYTKCILANLSRYCAPGNRAKLTS